MFCPNCRKELPDGTRFCGGCGTPIAVNQTPTAPVEPVAPVTPVTPVRPASVVRPAAHETGAPVAAPVKPAAKKAPDVKGIANKVVGTVTETVKKIPANYLKIGAIAVVAILVIILAVNIFGGEDVPNYALYVKDEQLYYSTVNGKPGSQVTDDLDYTYYNWEYILSEDGKKLFYIDNEDELYYRNTSNMKKDPVKLDSGVDYFTISEDGKTVIYVKNGNLFSHNLKKETKIAKNISGYPLVSADGKIVYFENDDGEVICWKNGKEEELGDDLGLRYISEDGKTIIYMDGDDVLLKTVGKKPKEIATDVASMTSITEDGCFYYTVYPEGDMADYFDDDDEIGDEEMYYLTSVYYFNGSKSKLVAENAYCKDRISGNDSVGLYYIQFGKVEEGSLSYDDLMDLYDDDVDDPMVELLTEASGKATHYISIDGKAAKVEIEDEVYDFYLSPDGKTLYALVDVDYKDDGPEGALLKASVSGGKAKAFKEIDSGINPDYIQGFVTNYAYYGHGEVLDANRSNYFVYFKDVKEGEGDLYVNGTEVGEAYYSEIRYNVGEKSLMYIVDYKDGEGTLMMYNGKKSIEIAEDVSSFVMHENGDIAFTTDYKDGEYTLCIYSGKVKEVAQDVVNFCFTADGEILYLTDYKKGEADLYQYSGKSKLIDEEVTQLLSVYDCDDN